MESSSTCPDAGGIMKTADFPSVKEARKEAMRRMEFYQRMMLPWRKGPMPKMTLLRSIEVEPTIEEIAQAFADMGSDGQAKFFHEVQRIVVEQYHNGMGGFDTQMAFAQDDLTPEGREVMRSIGNFADPQ